MSRLLPGNTVRDRGGALIRALGITTLLMFVLSGTAWAQQQTRVSGTVSSSAGGPLPGVTVRVEGTQNRAQTDAQGHYSIMAQSDAVLVFATVGQRPVQTTVSGRNTVDVTMERVTYLEEVVTTGYVEQRRADITGAVASVNIEGSQRQSAASLLQKLDANVAGVTVDNNGSPGSRSTVRIRGISSFQNNDPLYIVDGTPVQDSYINFLNPNDVTSIQVLKDASAASIYGSRASNGVVIIETTKKGVKGPPRATLSVRTGLSRPTNGLNDMLMQDPIQYFKAVVAAYRNAVVVDTTGGAHYVPAFTDADIPINIFGSVTQPTVPTYIFPNDCGVSDTLRGTGPGVCTNPDPTSYDYASGHMIMPGSQGTDWWSAVFGTGYVGDYNLDVNGGGDDNQYGVSFNYFNQKGTAAYNYFRRASVRVNTSFSRGLVNFGENIALSDDRGTGGQANDPGGSAEGGILGKNIMLQPVVPIYDVQGNFASGKANSLGNTTNPLKDAWSHRNDLGVNDRIFGNVFGGYTPLPELNVISRFGFNLYQGNWNNYSAPTPENHEATFGNSITDNSNRTTEWTWTNTANYRKTFMGTHNLSLLAGQEAIQSQNHTIQGGIANLINDNTNDRYIQDALGGAKTVFSDGGRSALLSFFGKADYNYLERYIVSATVRKDGSSNLGPENRWGTFPAFGLGWRLSKESFFPQNKWFNDVLIRGGWGVTGNQQIPSGRIVSIYGGGTGTSYYDISGSQTSIQPGYILTSIGNQNLKWEENRSTNVGADLTMFNGYANVVVDIYSRNTDNLLFPPATPGTAGTAAPPFVNIGKMSNKGWELSVGHRGVSWSATLNGSHYSNKIVRIDGVQSFFYSPFGIRYAPNVTINELGHPIGAFYGFVADGFLNSDAEALARTAEGGCGPTTAPCQPQAAPGHIKFKDLNGDGAITSADQTIIGSPHPSFTSGLDASYRRGNWDLAGTVFGMFGNKILDAQKQWYVFRNFETNLRSDMLTASWTPTHTDAKYPILDINDGFSHNLSSYYVENGSYVRLRTLQVGYTLPSNVRWAKSLAGARVYLSGENLFTFTGYEGLDPALPANNTTSAAGDVRDQVRGVDVGSYPSNKIFSIGSVTSF